MLSAQMKLAQERGQLISKRLVEAQSAWLLIAMRQKILGMPQTYARRLVGLKDVSEVQKVLKGAAISILNEIKDLASAVTAPNWLASLEKDGGQ
jgi:predicted thioredoxin/glutaredoxin